MKKGLSYKGAGLKDEANGIPLHNLNSVLEGGGYKNDGLKFYSGDYKPRHIVQPGDLIVANTEQGFDYLLIGYSALIPAWVGKEGLFSHHLFKVEPRPASPLSRVWLHFALSASWFGEAIRRYSNGTTVNMLPQDAFEIPEIIVPPSGLVRAFDEFVEPKLRRQEYAVGESRTLAQTRDLLLPKLMSGEIRLRRGRKGGGGRGMKFSESHVEDAALEWFSGLGYAVLHGPDISPDGPTPERVSYDQVLLTERLREALERLNPHLPAETLEEVLRKVQQTETPSLIEENRRLHRYLIEGVPVEVAREDGSIGGDVARLIDFDNVDANDWLAVNQYTVVEHGHNRRPDVVLFVNGLPLAVIELKNPGDENATLDGAFNQLQTYKDEIPSLFRTNAALVTSDGLHARLGSLTANLERFMPWRTVDGSAVTPKGTPELGTVIEGVFEKARFLTLMRDFTVFEDTGSGLVKIVAGYHQFHAVRHAVESTIAATSPEGDRRIGVIWHTQGSGKSLLMAFYAGQIIAHPAMENPTVVVITDRNDLDDQLFGTFAMCRDLLRQTPQQADSREDLQKAPDPPLRRRGVHDHPEVRARAWRDQLSGPDRPPQRRRDCRRGASQPVRLSGQGGAQDRRNLLWLRQVPSRRPAERFLHWLHRDAD